MVTDESVSAHVLERLNAYRESVGHDAYRQSLLVDRAKSAPWFENFAPEQRLLKQALWTGGRSRLSPLFDALADLTERWEQRSDEFKADLQGKVWRMLDL